MMEEVDNIIIHSLRQIGCDIEENITNLSGFNTELIIKATVKCLDIIRPGLGLSTVLPINMAARFRLGATLAQACLELGYKADVGYQTFLYSSETDLRKVFMFLIEKLPKESDKSLSEPVSNIVLLEKSIARAIAQSLSAPWLPHYCHTKGFRNKGRARIPYKSVNLEVSTVRKEENKEEYQDYCIHYLQSVPEQIQNEMTFLPSLISYNARALHSHSMSILDQINWLNEQYCDKITEVNESSDINILNRVPIQDKTLSSNELQIENNNAKEIKLIKQKIIDKTEKQDLQIEKIKTECETIKKDIEELQVTIKNLTTSVTQATINYQNEEKKLTINEEQKKIKARIYDLFQDGEENIKKLETAIEATTNKLINLGNQWEKHRVPLIQKYRQEREKHSTKANASQKKLDDIKLLKEKERELQEECRNKDQQYSQLVTEVQKLSKEVNRSAYTQRILEIINNIRKQRDEISKVLVDTREIQKEINTLTGRLERSFTVADELIFRDARTNEASRKAYKLLATLHSDCSELVNLVEETGATIREIRDLEEQIDSEATKNIGANLERITADLKQMKQETAELTAQLQNKNS
ncbi:coiled-coil domain-containing protein 22 homolog isoform X1 [Apis laboriosa]|uniref:coiled-coil domain-containing protein 22 homolog isoform X1 n=3 Tax=Apis laboriosa TaxID=183418 RepID=UPI001CC76A9D|nr:coiled-coil domain-containing protein 22 homolog isoform X1 [Apis laboriosa]XP_043799582.1 coiled-coil domain-containing protein 22 homolog isoform X1 [Apis laboriosa]